MTTVNIGKSSIVHWFPHLEKHKCGYCKNEDSSISYGMWAEQMTVDDYQNLIDRGWRRSGKYCYKPIMNQTCCPQYTIRCDTTNFILSKSQKKVVKKFNKFLNDGLFNKSPFDTEDIQETSNFEKEFVRDRPHINLDLNRLESEASLEKTCDISEPTHSDVSCTSHVNNSFQTSPSDNRNEEKSDVKVPSGAFKKGLGADPNRPPCKKAKIMRLERKEQKKLGLGQTSDEKKTVKNQSKSLGEFLDDVPAESKHKLVMKLVQIHEHDDEWEQVRNVEYQLYKKYQTIIHGDPPEKCTLKGFIRFLVSSPLKVKREQMSKGHPTFKIAAKLYEKYQKIVHNEPFEECNEKAFCEFLVDTPLKVMRLRGTNSAIHFGSFHLQYWLGDKLIAVGVLDILPRCVSSVYFFYDPDYRSLTLGTYSSLREIQFVRSLQENASSVQYYYMGYYIHSCPKMRYKGRLSSSYLLCPETYVWFPIDKCIPKLETSKYARFNDDPQATDENMCTQSDIDRIKVIIGYTFTDFGNYKRRFGGEEVFQNIGTLIGRTCSNSLLFVVNTE